MTQHSTFITDHSMKRVRVGVDLVPVLPGGDNGGAKLVAMELVRYLGRLAPNWEFVLFTSEKSHDELTCLDSSNVSRCCVLKQESAFDFARSPVRRLESWLGKKLDKFVPSRAGMKLNLAYKKAAGRFGHGDLLREKGIDLLFCPFTAPFLHDPSIPVVSIVHDLQFQYYPQFFSPEDRLCRERSFMEACRLADRLICVSEYVRGTVLEHSGIDPGRVRCIHTGLHNRLVAPPPQVIHSVLRHVGLRENEFLLYPANFWAHKNHRMLFTAFGMYHARHPGSNLLLVCTGALEHEKRALSEAAERMGLSGKIVLPGFVSEEEFAAMLASSLALVFPSLFEGFGMPVLEAMAFRKPVICSNVAGLPEIAGDAPLYVDPRKPRDMAEAMGRIATDESLRNSLVALGEKRLAGFNGPEEMAREYLEVFVDVMNKPAAALNILQGVYADGWTADRMLFKYGKTHGARQLEAVFHLPSYLPHKVLSITVSDQSGRSNVRSIKRGDTTTVRFDLSDAGALLRFRFDPGFQPKACGINDDERVLGCICQGCWIVSETGRESLVPYDPMSG